MIVRVFPELFFTAFGDWRRNIQIIFTISGWRENARGAISSSSLTFTRRGKMRAKCLSLSYKVEGNERDTMMMMGVNTKQQAGPQLTKPIPLPINHDPFSFSRGREPCTTFPRVENLSKLSRVPLIEQSRGPFDGRRDAGHRWETRPNG